MRALIGPDLIRRLPARDIEIRDTKLTGFLVRCRASGTHIYRYVVGRAHNVTLGRVDTLPVAEARAAAEALQSAISRGTLERLGTDAEMNQREARAKTRATLRLKRAGRRVTWTAFVNEYEKLATGDMKTARETLRRLRGGFGSWFGDDARLDTISPSTSRGGAPRDGSRA